jgi:hypothetical protein
METKRVKEPYIDPELSVLETEAEGMVCASGGEYPDWPGEDI